MHSEERGRLTGKIKTEKKERSMRAKQGSMMCFHAIQWVNQTDEGKIRLAETSASYYLSSCRAPNYKRPRARSEGGRKRLYQARTC